MLAVLDRPVCRQFEFVAVAPSTGPLVEALDARGIRRVPLQLRDGDDKRLPRDVVCENLCSALSAVSPDIVHANSLSMGRLTGAIADQIGVPTIVHLRDILKLSRAAIDDLNRNRLLIAVSQATRNFHVAQHLDAERSRVLYNGVDCAAFRPRPATGELKRELGLPDDVFLVVTIGQIGLRKGQDVLAEAAVRVAESTPDVHYLVVGVRNSSKQESIEFESNLIARFEAAGLGDRLHRLGYRGDVEWIMNEADLLVHPANQEPLGRVLLEAAASGLPIIATNVGGTPEIVEDGSSARLIAPNDPTLLASAVLELRSDGALRERLAVAARKRAETVFDSDAAARGLCRVWGETGE
jgi:glycosyltransferase involved in cell wall biosynthesis